MRSAHHFGPNKGYHHVVAFLTIAHRNPLIKWALCRTSYKRACYTIVGSNNNTRRGQLSKRSQSHRGGVRVRGGTGGEGGGERGCSRKHQGLCGKMWRRLKEGNGWEEAFAMKGEAEKKPSSQKQLSMTVRGQTTGEDPEHSRSAALAAHRFFFSIPLQLTLSKNPNKLNVHRRHSHWVSEVGFGF